MRRLVDLGLLLLCLLASPVWVLVLARRGKLRTDWAGRLGRGPTMPPPRPERPRVLIHAVSVGEVNAVRGLIDALEGEGADGEVPLEVVLSSTTDTGVQRARDLRGPKAPVFRTPFDFDFAMRRWLDRVSPDVLVLVELEVWPTMTRLAAARGIPIVVVNGRLSERSFERSRRLARLLRPAYGRLAAVGAQEPAVQNRFVRLGTPEDRVEVLGTMKWDNARIDRAGPDEAALALAEALGIDRNRPLVVAGSTAPEETRLIDDAVGDRAQLLLAPRRPEWFDDAAVELEGCARRSLGQQGSPRGRFLLDTIGELGAAYALADVVIMGRSFGARHGSDMMEPAGLGKPVVSGPAVTDFRVVAHEMRTAGALRIVEAEDLAPTVRALLLDAGQREEMGRRALEVIRRNQGSTARHAALVRRVLGAR